MRACVYGKGGGDGFFPPPSLDLVVVMDARHGKTSPSPQSYIFPFASPSLLTLKCCGRGGTDDFAFSKVPEGESDSGGDVSQTFLKSSLPFFSLRLPPSPPASPVHAATGKGRKER